MQKTLFGVPTKKPVLTKPTKQNTLPLREHNSSATDDNPIAERINRKRRQILIHSCIYYRLNSNIISDSVFATWALQLVDLQEKYPAIAAKCVYADAFKNFDGTTGFDLPLADGWVHSTAQYILRIHEAKTKL